MTDGAIRRVGVVLKPTSTEATELGRKLLEELQDVPADARTARFVCSLCVAGPDGQVLAAIEEVCEGVLRTAPTGEGGFGYDPIFVPVEHRDDMEQSFAVLGADVKDRLSHRGKALRALAARLPALLTDS